MDNAVIATGWPRVRDLANMFIVLGFVFIGIATTLRIGDYEAKKLLPKLIMVALLINFSLVICGIFIDAANITATYFLKSGGFFATSWSQTIGDQISVIWGQWKSNSSYVDAGIGVLKVVGGLLFYDIMAAVIFFLYAFLYIFRMMSLWILVILSPLAFVCYVFPFTKSIFNMWWSNFFQWCIIIVPVSFFVWIADKLTEGMSNAGKASPMAYLVPGSFMLLGFLFSIKIAPMGAGAAVGLAKGTVGFVSGAVPGATSVGMKGLNALTGGRAGEATEKVKRGYGRAMERVGFRQIGATATDAKDTVDKLAKNYGDEFAAAKVRGDTAGMDRIRALANTGRGSKGAGALKAIIEQKDLQNTFKNATGGFDAASANARISYAESAGAIDIRKKASAQSPTIAGHHNPTVDSIHRDHPGWTRARAQQEAVVRTATSVPEDELDRDFVNSMDSGTLTMVADRMTNKKKEILKRNNLVSVRQERQALARGRAARAALSPQQRARWTELLAKERLLSRI
jgi:hypothetical protein